MKPLPRLWFRFGPFRLCPSEGVLLRDGEQLSVSPRTFDTLAFLVKNSPNLVTVEELIAGVWNNLSVEPNNVTQHVFSVRKLLGDNSQNPTYIQNVPRRGYRFIAPVEQSEEQPATTPHDQVVATIPVSAKIQKSRWLVASVATILIALPLTTFLPVAAPELRITGYRQLTHDGGRRRVHS